MNHQFLPEGRQMDTLESFLDVKFGVERTNDVYRFTVTPEAKR